MNGYLTSTPPTPSWVAGTTNENCHTPSSPPAGVFRPLPRPRPRVRSGVSDVPQDRDILFAEFSPLVHRLSCQYGKDPELAQDIRGEIYYRFCTLLNAYDPSRNIPVRAYLVRQLSASVFTYARQQWRRQKRELATEDIGMFCPEQVEDPTAAWDDALAMQEFSRALPDLLKKIPPRQAKVVIWRYYDDVPFEEIAERLGVKMATARSLLRHGLTHLRRLGMEANPFAD